MYKPYENVRKPYKNVGKSNLPSGVFLLRKPKNRDALRCLSSLLFPSLLEPENNESHDKIKSSSS